jgi:hypothetical protein
MIENQFESSASFTEMESRIFNGSDLASMYNPNPSNIYNLYKRPEKKFHPVNLDEQSLNYLYIKASNRYGLLIGSITWLSWLKDKANKILTELKNEYHLE